MDAWKNQLFFGDNLKFLGDNRIPVNSVDLIYLDPPFNSNAAYNILFAEKSGEKSGAQITAFEDTWHWGDEARVAYDDVVRGDRPRLAELLQALRAFLGQNDMMAYLTMMAVRLTELHRVLKPTGSLYLHCDQTASHYLKLILDAIFGTKHFRNEIIWAYKGGGSSKKDFPKRHDVIFRYSNTNHYNFYPDTIRIPYEAEGIKRTDDSMWGRHKGTSKIYKPHPLGKVPEDWWPINILNANDPERLGYPTQKPEALLERIIRASSNEGDVVLDPFCGCGTTISVAERLKRRWIGIDITILAINLIKKRLHDTFSPAELAPYEVIGEPVNVKEAEALALEKGGRYQFEWWALGKVDAFPAQDKKKGADKGVDGVIYFQEKDDGPYHKIIVQVKSGHIGAKEVRELEGTRKQEKAVIAALITSKPITKPMREAAGADFFVPEQFSEFRFPRIQILTVTELFEGKQLNYPRWVPPKTFKKAARRYKGPTSQEQEKSYPQLPNNEPQE